MSDNFGDEDTPVVPLDDRMQIDQLRAQVDSLRIERDKLAERDRLLKVYEVALKSQLGHIVELLKAGIEWRNNRDDRLATERLCDAIDRAVKVEGERGKPTMCQKTGVHEFVNDVCRYCGLVDD